MATWRSDDLNSQSIFAGDGLVSTFIKQSWERFARRPAGSQQAAYFVSLKELPDNRFGTQSEIYWDDGFNTQVGAVTRGSYTLKIVDPILFVKNRAGQLPSPARCSTSPIWTTPPPASCSMKWSVRWPRPSARIPTIQQGNRITRLQQDSIGFAQSLSAAVEQAYQWQSDRGLAIVKTAIVSIEYDANTRELLKTVQRADALSGSRGIPTCRPASPRASSRPARTAVPQAWSASAWPRGCSVSAACSSRSPRPRTTRWPLKKAKEMLDLGLITQGDYDALKAKALGL